MVHVFSMTHMPVSEAKGRLADLVRRAEAGEDVVLTRHGKDVVRLTAVAGVAGGKSPEEKRRIIREIQARVRSKLPSDFDAARSADFLYGDDGLPG